MRGAMSNIPYFFHAIPEEFMTDEFLEDIPMMKLVRYIMKRIRYDEHEETLRVNRTTVKVLLKPFEWVFGREMAAKECNTTPQIIRARINQQIRMGYAIKSTSSSTSSYTVYAIVPTAFRQNKNQQFNQQFNHNTDNKKPNVKKEQQSPTPKGTCVVFSCLEKINDPTIGKKEKERITRKNEGNEKVVIDAVDSVLQSSFTPETTLLRSLNAAIKGQWKPLPEKEDSIKLNKKKALELQMKGHQYYKIEACSTYLEIIAGPISHVVQYDLQSDKFDKQVMEHLKIGKQA